MTELLSTNPRTGESTTTGIIPTSTGEVAELALQAATAQRGLARMSRRDRAAMLRAMAEGLESLRAQIVDTADAETGLGEARLNGELTRTCFQLRMFADVVAEGAYLEATIDHAGDTEMGPRPDLRRMLIPLGPVAVFGASNFPLAFSVPGGDTASALAAGCAVVAKAHESHPLTSRLCGEALAAAAEETGAPKGAIAVVYGREAGADLVRHPAIAAVGFTGSLSGGRALMELVGTRETPIPFYGELSGINPLLVTQAAAEERPEDIASGLTGSFTLGSGQFCTKPGLAFVPSTPAGDRLASAVSRAAQESQAQVLLNSGIQENYERRSQALAQRPGVREAARGAEAPDGGAWGRVQVLETDADALDAEVARECFGPLVVLVRYRDEGEVLDALGRLEPSLTAAVHLTEKEAAQRVPLLEALQEVSGRVVFNGYPTGVAVAWAQHHGGPWPSTNAIHTSVGPTAIRRFVRPYTWQNAPEAVLPQELRDEESDVPRRVDGTLVPGASRD